MNSNINIDLNGYKNLLSNYPSGVVIVTTLTNNHEPVGLTANSFISVSIDPTLILWSIDKKVSSYLPFINAKTFVVHILANDQCDLCKLFASKGSNRFNNDNWFLNDYNNPELKDVLGVLQCETYKLVDAGDHTLIIGKVIDLKTTSKEPLLYHKRLFGKIPSEFYK